jgi:hypothetical protein
LGPPPDPEPETPKKRIGFLLEESHEPSKSLKQPKRINNDTRKDLSVKTGDYLEVEIS